MQRNNVIPALEKFQSLASSILNPEVQAFKNQGGKVVGCFDPDVPVEILEAAGLLPFDMRGTGADGTEYADAYFRQLTCEFTRTTFQQIISGEYAFLDGAVVYNCCDHLRRIFDNWKTLPNCPAYHFIYVPKMRGEQAYGVYQEEIRAFIAATEEKFGVKITAEKLSAAIAESNKTRALVRELYELRKLEAPLIDGAEVAAVLTAGGSIPRATYNALLRQLIDELKANNEGVKPVRRLMFISGHANKPELFATLESQGGMVVADVASSGALASSVDIETGADPFEDLMKYYYWQKAPSPRFFGTQQERMQTIVKMINDYKVDGVISARLTMCDVWAFEQYMVAGLCEENDIPHLELEVNYILDGLGQIRTRMQAFVENCPKRF